MFDRNLKISLAESSDQETFKKIFNALQTYVATI